MCIRDSGKYARDRLVLALPVIGETVQYALVERFCRILASMVGAGVSLPQALRVATDSLHNLVFSRALAGVSDAMLEGEGLASPLVRSGLFPPTAAQMMRVGEETGTLDNQLAVTVLKEIADEERVHAGEFLRLLHELAPDEAKFYAKGAKEVEEEIKKMK